MSEQDKPPQNPAPPAWLEPAGYPLMVVTVWDPPLPDDDFDDEGSSSADRRSGAWLHMAIDHSRRSMRCGNCDDPLTVERVAGFVIHGHFEDPGIVRRYLICLECGSHRHRTLAMLHGYLAETIERGSEPIAP